MPRCSARSGRNRRSFPRFWGRAACRRRRSARRSPPARWCGWSADRWRAWRRTCSALGVRTARARLTGSLRSAVLRSQRPELLLRYSRLPEAADDAAVWQGLLDVLPVSSPRRAAAAGQLLRLRRPSR